MLELDRARCEQHGTRALAQRVGGTAAALGQSSKPILYVGAELPEQLEHWRSRGPQHDRADEPQDQDGEGRLIRPEIDRLHGTSPLANVMECGSEAPRDANVCLLTAGSRKHTLENEQLRHDFASAGGRRRQ